MFDNFPLWPSRASTAAGNVDALFIFLLIVSGLMTLLIFTAVVYFAARYRHRKGVLAEQIEGSTPLELTWSIIPMGVFMVIFLWGAVVYFKSRTPPRDATEVYVVAKQWMWKLEHAEGQREINELHVPVGRDVKLIMTSQDVIHSFYVPAFRMKQDVVPGRYTVAWFHADQGWHLPSILRGILRHPALRHDRLHRGPWSPRSTKLGWVVGPLALSPPPEKKFSPSSAASPAIAPTRKAVALSARCLRQASSAAGRPHRDRGRKLSFASQSSIPALRS